jgi:hypothetical protein
VLQPPRFAGAPRAAEHHPWPSQQRHPLLPVPRFTLAGERGTTRAHEVIPCVTLAVKLRELAGRPCKLTSAVIPIMRCRIPNTGGADGKTFAGS